ncbi:MAG: hypothetical protein EBR82_40695 [Caulobacteraceae bacterium]|nr:hypothetical protein [Caulobacteraceae bacterium]
MNSLRILEANEIGYGILIESDAGWIDPKDQLNINLIQENKKLDYKNPFEFYAVLQKHDVPNRNGRTYPEKILKREAERYKKIIEKGLSTSELNHPESSLIDLDRVAHLITDIWWDSNILMGKLLLLTSPGFHERGIVSTKGDVAANLMRQGVSLGISSRGVGSLKKVGEKNEVQDDFELICFDLVSSPSTPGAYLFSNKEDRHKYDEKLEEEKKIDSSNNILKLMNKLDGYLK